MPDSPFHALRAVAIDLDGTLLSPELSVSEDNRAAIEELSGAGVEVILASGRHYTSMLPIARSLPAVRYMVSSQGAYASDLDKSLVLYESRMPAQDARMAIETGLREGLAIVAYTSEDICSITPASEWIDYYARLAGFPPRPVTVDELMQLTIFKIVYFGTAQRLDEIEELPEIASAPLYKVRSLANIFEQADPATNKAAGLDPLLKHLGIPAAQTAVFGDAPNDIPMFEYAGYAIAMDRAWESTRKAATHIAPAGPPESSFARGVELLKSALAAGAPART